MRFNLRFDVTVDADQMTGTSKAGRLPTGTCFYLNARPNHAVNSRGAMISDPKVLYRAMRGLNMEKARLYAPHMNEAMLKGDITTLRRAQYWIAQLAHESVDLRYFEEIASGAAYEGRRDLGNTRPGDGRRFKGRGPIQLTGRSN